MSSASTQPCTASIDYDSGDDGSYTLGLANVQLAATNAGARRSRGGVWRDLRRRLDLH